MAKRAKKRIKINPNEFGGLLYDIKELKAISRVLFDGKIFRYSSKKPSAADDFESKIKEYLGVKFAHGLNSGTSALAAALKSVGVKAGDRVLISAYTFIATPASVVNVGAVPIPIDLDLDTAMNLSQLEKEINKRCSAIIPVHLQGRAFDIRPIIKLARRKNIPVIEDACQAFGARYGQTFAGCFGDIGVFSFQQYKQISSGEGGMIVTNNKDYYQKAKIYSDNGVVRENMSWDVNGAMIGDNLRMNNLQAAILNVQLNKLPWTISAQKKYRSYILSAIQNLDISCILNSRDVQGETGMNILFLASSAAKASAIMLHAKQKNIEFRYLWDRPYYQHGVFDLNRMTPKYLKSDKCENADSISKRLISLSVPPVLSRSELDVIIEEIRDLHKFNYFN
jgi:8-amino-3,8-dideoxy-alpha-D-manno-octulosonate transaminase